MYLMKTGKVSIHKHAKMYRSENGSLKFCNASRINNSLDILVLDLEIQFYDGVNQTL